MAKRELREKRITLRLKEREYKALKKLAKRQPIGAFIRGRLFSNLELYGAQRLALENALGEMAEYRHILSRNSSNLNQLAKMFNYGTSPSEAFIQETLANLKQSHHDIFNPIKEIYDVLCQQR